MPYYRATHKMYEIHSQISLSKVFMRCTIAYQLIKDRSANLFSDDDRDKRFLCVKDFR